jgi:arylsulfatase A-like enzyme
MRILIICILTLLVSCTAEPEKPNIMFIFADDQTFKGVHALGNDEVITPNLDKLAGEGVTFTHTYNMGGWNGAICVASRAMLNTGRMLWRAQAAEKEYEGMRDNRLFWAQRMEDAGYETYMTGKWHVKMGADQLFQNTVHIRPGMPGTVASAYNRPLSRDDREWLPWDTANGGFWKDGKHWSEVVADDALGFIEKAGKSENPFFMYLAFNAPHDPRQSPKEYVDMYPVDAVEIPVSFLPEYPYKDFIGCSETLRDEKLAPFPRTPYSIQVHRQEYYAIISHMDAQVGRILKGLEDSGMSDNTYIFFSADHGLAVGHHGLVGKQNMYDHSVRVPLIIAGPGVPENQKRDQQVYLQDIMATALDLAGDENPAFVEFNSLMPMIKKKNRESSYPYIYGAYLNLQRSIRSEEYKLILYPEAEKMLLFNVLKDPEEMVDLSGDDKYSGMVESLCLEFQKLQDQMDDTLDLSGNFPGYFSKQPVY